MFGLACLLLLAGCASAKVTGSTSAPNRATTTTRPVDTYTEFAHAGPYAAGTMTMSVHGDLVVVWYPAPPSSTAGKTKFVYHVRSFLPKAIQSIIPKSFPDGVTEDAYAGLPVASGEFPVVLFSHGFSGFPDQSTFLTAHLATWGFIVAAADQTSMDIGDTVLGKLNPSLALNIRQQTAALAAIRALGRASSSIFSGHVNESEAGIVGHSAGGETAVATAAADPAIKVVVSLAGVPATPPKRSLPMLFMTGSSDHVVPSAGIELFYEQVRAPKGLLVIDGTGHNVFDDVCTIARSEGGLGGAAKLLHLPVPSSILGLAADGCKPPDVYPPIAWPLIDQATIAELRYGFGQDSSPVGLGPGLDHAFHGVTGVYSSDI